MILKKILMILVILFLSIDVVCASGELRSYFFNEHFIDLTFAKKLAQCQKYETPVKYTKTWYAMGLIPETKGKVKIVGMDKENRCIVRSYEADYLSLTWKKDYEYHLPKYILPYFSDIYITAFGEKYMAETKAIEKVHSLCAKYRDFCLNADKEKYPELINYIRAFGLNSSIPEKYLYYDESMPNCYPLKGGYCKDVKFN